MKLDIISKHPRESRRPTPLLFIHGTLHGAWCWDVHFLDCFARHGFAAHAVDPGAVLLSSTPPSGLVRTISRIAWRHPWVFAKVDVTLRLLPVIATPQLARDAFFSADLPDEELRAYWQLMQDES